MPVQRVSRQPASPPTKRKSDADPKNTNRHAESSDVDGSGRAYHETDFPSLEGLRLMFLEKLTFTASRAIHDPLCET